MTTTQQPGAKQAVPGLRLRPYAGEADLPDIVDVAENPSDALGLYESFGFQVEARLIGWRKPFEETHR